MVYRKSVPNIDHFNSRLSLFHHNHRLTLGKLERCGCFGVAMSKADTVIVDCQDSMLV